MLALGSNNGHIRGIQYPHSESSVINIQYADDTVIFLTPSLEGVVNLKRILCCFQVCSGLKINFNKSSISGMGVPDDLLLRACDIMGYIHLYPCLLNTWVYLCTLKRLLSKIGLQL